MLNFSHCDDLMKLLMKRKYACCFHFDFASGELEYNGNFPKERLFCGEASDPIEGLLKSASLLDSDKGAIAGFYSELQKARRIPNDNLYFECIVRLIDTEGGEMPVPLSISIGPEYGKDGLVCGLNGYTASLANFVTENNLRSAVAPFPVETVTKALMETEQGYAIVQFDICRFKLINEKYGDDVGDAVLENIRTNLENAWGRKAVTCRLGADIFTVFTEYEDLDELESRIKNVREKLQSYKNIKYRFSFGVYIVEDKEIPLRTMTDNASIARRRAKDSAVEAVQFFEDSLSDELRRRHLIESQMQAALEGGQFEVYLQPKCRIEDGEIIGAEALSRWNHPQKGVVPPDKFIPIFEENGFIEEFDRHIHEKVCKILRSWLDSGVKCIPISVNVSRACVDSMKFAQKIKGLVDKYGIPVEFFQIEITETYDSKEFDEAIGFLKSNGFKLLMDDFGSGFSSLNILKSTPFDVIKLDRKFLGHSLSSERGQKILTHTIAMTNDIGLEVVAEGVETGEQADFLDRNGCKYAQGYYYLRPVPIAEFENTAFGRTVCECV